MSDFLLLSDIEQIVKNIRDVSNQFSGKTVLLTGGRGFLGRYFMEIFNSLNEQVLKEKVKVIVLDNLITSGKEGADIPSYEQIELGSDIIDKNQSKYLVENDNIVLQFYNEKVVALELPDSIILEVKETEGVVKGQTAASSYKPAILERNIKTTVPQFISINDKVVISTIDGSYIEKAKI